MPVLPPLIQNLVGNSTSFNSMMTQASFQMNEMAELAGRVGAAVTGAFQAVITDGVNAAGALEQTKIAFNTLLGSGEAVDELFSDLSDFADGNAFSMSEIRTTALDLLRAGESGDELLIVMDALGNAAAGTGSSLQGMSGTLNEVRSAGKLVREQFDKLRDNGVISLKDIQKHFGVTEDAARSMVDNGLIQFDEFRGMLIGLSEDGEKFAGKMIEAAETLPALWAIWTREVKRLTTAFGEEFLPIAKQVAQWSVDFIKWVRDLPPWVLKSVASVVMFAAGLLGLVTALSVIGIGIASVSAAFTGMAAGATIAATAAAGTTITVTGLGVAIGLLNLALSGFLIVATAVAAFELGRRISEWTGIATAGTLSVEELNEELAKMARHDDKILDRQQRSNQKVWEEIDQAGDGGREPLLKKAIKDAETALGGLNFQAGRAKKELEYFEGQWFASGDVEVTEKKVAAAAKRVEDMKAHIRELKQELGEVPPVVLVDPKVLEDAQKHFSKLKETTRFLKQQEGGIKDRKLFEFKEAGVDVTKMVAEQEKIDKLKDDAAQKEKDRKEEIQNLEKNRADVDQTIANLTKEIALFEKGAEARLAYEMAGKKSEGVDPAKIEEAQMLTKQLEDMKDLARLTREGQSITEQFMSKKEKLLMREKELQEHLDAKTISSDTFEKAMKAARKELEGAADEADRLNAILNGTTEIDMASYGEMITEKSKDEAEARKLVQNIEEGIGPPKLIEPKVASKPDGDGTEKILGPKLDDIATAVRELDLEMIFQTVGIS